MNMDSTFNWRAGARLRVLVATVLLGASLSAASPAAEAKGDEDLKAQVEALRAEVARLQQQGASERVSELERRIDLLAAEIEKARMGGAEEATPTTTPQAGLGPAASKVYAKAKGVSLGGYGEVLYQRPSTRQQDGTASGAEARIDLLRYITYIGYKFSDRILLNSEVEVEHALVPSGGEEKGELAIEFAYLEFRPWKNVGLRAGTILVPLGFLNELHEPPVFHGARRNEVERQIVPTTWSDNGAGIFGQSGAFEWRGVVVAGLDSAGFTAEGIREGRQEASESKASDMGVAARLDYTGIPGLLAGAAVFSSKSGQGATIEGRKLDGRVTLLDVHAQYERRGLQVRALFARSSVGDVALINAQNGLFAEQTVGERQYGWYVQAAYDVAAARPLGRWSVTPFLRYERLNPQDRVPEGFDKDPALDQTVWTGGVGVRPLPNVVLKADYQWLSNRARTGTNQLNVAVGYLF
jgi:hypothetical protein